MGEEAEAGQSQGFTTGPMQFSLGGMPAEATATIHVQTEGGAGPPSGLAEAISAMMQQANSVMGGAGGPLEGNISIRVENGRVVQSGTAPASTAGEAGSGAESSGGSSGAGSVPGSPAGIRHPPPALLAELLHLYNAAQARLAGLSNRLITLLREDPVLEATYAVEQTFYNRYSGLPK